MVAQAQQAQGKTKKDDKTTSTATAKTATTAASDEPEGDGWEELGTPDLDGWYKPEKGVIVQGTVVGRLKIRNDDGQRHIILIRLDKPCRAVVEGGTRNEPAMAELQPGQILAVGMRHRLRELLLCVANQLQVWFRAEGEKAIKGGRSIWEFTIKVNSKSGAKAPPPPLTDRFDEMLANIDAPAGADTTDDDIPF